MKTFFMQPDLSMQKIFLTCISLFFSISVVACGSGEKEATNNQQSQKAGEKQPQKAKLGTRSNPVPFTQSTAIDIRAIDDDLNDYPGKIEMSVTEAVRGVEAHNKLKTMDGELE